MSVAIRKAQRDDVVHIVAMLADDELGAKREDYRTPLPQAYYDAFESIDRDPNQELVVATLNDEVIGTLQLTRIPYLTYIGGWRALVEAVRIRSDQRGTGLGAKMLEWAIERARETNCHLIQLTSDKARSQAISFYEKHGFQATHEGMKLWLKGGRKGS